MTRYRDDRDDNRDQGNQNRDWQNRDWNDDRSRDHRSGIGQGYGMSEGMGRSRDDRSYRRGDDFDRDQCGMNWDDRRGLGGMGGNDRSYGGQGGRPQGYGMGYGQDDARSYNPQRSKQGMGGQGYGQRDMDDRYGQQSRTQGQSQGYGMGQGRYGSDADRPYSSYGGQERGYDWQGLRQAGGQRESQYGYGMDSQYGAQRSTQGGGGGGQYGQSQYGQQSYRGRGPSSYRRSDERIKEQVNEALEDDDQVDAENITVELQNGEVTLTGTVSDRFQKRAAEYCVERVRGLKDVHNQLRVQYGSQGQGMQSQGMQGQSSSHSTLSSMGAGSASGQSDNKSSTAGTGGNTASTNKS